MLDIQFIRQHPDLVKQACKHKQLDEKVVDDLLELDAQRRQLQQQVDELRQQTNQNADAIKVAVQKEGKPPAELVATGKKIKTQLKEIEPHFKDITDKWTKLQYFIPNIAADEVPVGANESGNQVVKTIGEQTTFDFEPQPHHVIMENLGWLDTKHAVEIGGFRSYFLQNQGLLLEQAILRLAQKQLLEAGFTPMNAPILVNEQAMWGTGYFPWGQEDHYKTQDNQILAGTAEVALTAYYQGETLREKDLPIKMMGISPCFRREIGAHGQDTQGVIRVHQFNKVEQVVYTIADETETQNWHQKMLGFSEKLLQTLGLPYQVLLMCTGDMGAGQRKKFDVETWFPSQQKYRETHSASYFNDFQARRLGIKYQTSDGQTKFVYTLNNTMAATPRLLAAVVENFQTKDGQVAIPEVLQNLM